MKNHWLNKKQPELNSLYVPLDYGDPSLDFFAAKAKIIEYLKARYKFTDEALEHALIQDIIDNWAYAADLLSQRAAR